MDQDAANSSAQEGEVKSCRLAEVVPGLWIGPLASVTEIRKVPRRWTVISLLSSPKLADFIQKSLQEVREVIEVEHFLWEIKDQSQAALISPRLEEVLCRMDQALLDSSASSSSEQPRACLVHCAFGVSRSASVCAAWLLSRRRYTTVEDALACIRQARPEIMPNMGFLAGLRALEQCDGDVSAAVERMARHNSNA